MDGLELGPDCEGAGLEHRKLWKAVAEFAVYRGANGAWIPNYCERYRNGETASRAFFESAVNQIVAQAGAGPIEGGRSSVPVFDMVWVV